MMHVKEFIAILSRAVGLNALLVSYHKSRLKSAGEAMKRFGTETTMEVGCSQRFQRHFQALQQLGFMVQKEFALERRSISDPECYRAFCRLLRARFSDKYWSCAASGTQVIVTARPSQMLEWEQFLSEYDQPA